MLVGQVGLWKNHAALLVAVDKKFFLVLVQVLLLSLAEDLALELVTQRPRRRKLIFIPYFNLQLTVVGQVGVDGLHARKPVEPVLNNVLEAARDRLLVMVANLALEVGWKDKCATKNIARVSARVVLIIEYSAFVRRQENEISGD